LFGGLASFETAGATLLVSADLTHFDAAGASRMVDVSAKEVTLRTATASGLVRMQPATLARIQQGTFSKGNVLEVARLAGIMAAKRTAEWIPLCHTLPLESVTIAFEFADERTLAISATTSVSAKTGVEMEALVAVSTAALTVYDMCKAIDRGLVIERIQLEEKSGGRSGHFVRETPEVLAVQEREAPARVPDQPT
jgi:cyclic pyranopterin phosphate synthase